MKESELQAYGINLPDADEPIEQWKEWMRKAGEESEEAIENLIRASKEAWAASFTKIFG